MNIFGSKYHLLKKISCDIAAGSGLVIFFIISCTTIKSGKVEQKEISQGDKLSSLDDKLKCFAMKHNTPVRSSKPAYYNSMGNPPDYDSLENREVSWIDDSIAKAIFILPYSTNSGVSPNTWNFHVVAWLFYAPSFEKPHWTFYLLKNANIKTLEQNIDKLLIQSEEKLNNVKIDDLK